MHCKCSNREQHGHGAHVVRHATYSERVSAENPSFLCQNLHDECRCHNSASPLAQKAAAWCAFRHIYGLSPGSPVTLEPPLDGDATFNPFTRRWAHPFFDITIQEIGISHWWKQLSSVIHVDVTRNISDSASLQCCSTFDLKADF